MPLHGHLRFQPSLHGEVIWIQGLTPLYLDLSRIPEGELRELARLGLRQTIRERFGTITNPKALHAAIAAFLLRITKEDWND